MDHLSKGFRGSLTAEVDDVRAIPAGLFGFRRVDPEEADAFASHIDGVAIDNLCRAGQFGGMGGCPSSDHLRLIEGFINGGFGPSG
ncbi:MAG: hypothetical protein FJX65_19035, partial [Alphaproteobacteria bacterium]|nr:hypothetical protein [Alphaproteobacteria bacterium]